MRSIKCVQPAGTAPAAINDTFGHFEFQDESINNAPKHRAVVGGGGR
ncbi:MAG: hypothetical protein Kow00105_13730 [Phycisphaeraceae bacterium]